MRAYSVHYKRKDGAVVSALVTVPNDHDRNDALKLVKESDTDYCEWLAMSQVCSGVVYQLNVRGS